MTALWVLLGCIVGAGLLGVGFWAGFRVGSASSGGPTEREALPGILAPKFEPMTASAASEVELAMAEAEEEGRDRPHDPGRYAPDY